jgi:hypothetical protein
VCSYVFFKRDLVQRRETNEEIRSELGDESACADRCGENPRREKRTKFVRSIIEWVE